MFNVEDGDKIPLITKEIAKEIVQALTNSNLSHIWVNNNIQIFTHKQILKKNKYKCVKQLSRKRANSNQLKINKRENLTKLNKVTSTLLIQKERVSLLQMVP